MEDFVGRHQELLNLVSVKRRDLVTFVHLLNVTLLSMFFASKLQFSKDDVLDLGIAALYHDVGKLYISLKVIQKKDMLSEGEFVQVRNHPLLGAKILDSYKDALGVLPIVVSYEHHLRYDMAGYPKSPYARRPHAASMIVSICDVYDALALKRSYKKDYPPEKIHELMMLEKGKIFDPQLLDKFFQFMGAWPVGTLVSMSDGRVGVVRAVNEQDIFRPSVQVLAPENAGEVVNLVNQGDVRILGSLNPHAEGSKYLPLIGCPPPAASDEDDEVAEALDDD
jgi:HD-GYP domain-containing protein (c-di-GMP phosphodiesterase class II)